VEVDVNLGLSEEELIKIIPDYSAIIVRSATKVTAPVLEAAEKLRAIGRAGVGVDNIDIPAATNKGAIVMNTPAGNTISTAEHAFSLMCSLARRIPHAHANVRAGKWGRKDYQGVELYKKTLAILGMGRIGGEFARRAMAFGMRVIAYDPYLSESRAKLMRVELAENLQEALAEADFITMHMPSTPETHHLLNAETLAQCKPGVRIINCARGGLVDEAALLDALNSGQVAGAALDVFEEEPPGEDFPLREREDMVFTPHLGASTAEAQENVGIEITKTIRDYLLNGTVVNAVNMPSIDQATAEAIGPYLELGSTLGRLLSQIAPTGTEAINITYSGKAGDLDTTLISRTVLKGYLERAVGAEEVNQINAPSVAEGLGIKFSESHSADPANFSELIEVKASKGDRQSDLAGTFFGSQPRIVTINGRHVEADPSASCLLLLENNDVPGMVGSVGSLLGEKDVNIASMSLSRNQVGGKALVVLNLDSQPEQEVLTALEAIEGIESAQCLSLS